MREAPSDRRAWATSCCSCEGCTCDAQDSNACLPARRQHIARSKMLAEYIRLGGTDRGRAKTRVSGRPGGTCEHQDPAGDPMRRAQRLPAGVCGVSARRCRAVVSVRVRAALASGPGRHLLQSTSRIGELPRHHAWQPQPPPAHGRMWLSRALSLSLTHSLPPSLSLSLSLTHQDARHTCLLQRQRETNR